MDADLAFVATLAAKSYTLPILCENAAVFSSLTARKEWNFFGALPKADAGLATAWWIALLLRGILPAVFAIAMGVLVGAVQRGQLSRRPLAFAGTIFVLLQVLSPIHQALSSNLGDRTAAWLYDRLTEACVRPPGMGHLEDPALTSDLTVAREFDLGMTGPPLSISMDFIASGMVEMIGGIACAMILARYAWWAPIVLAGAWLATHWLLRESAIWRDRNTEEVRGAQRDADYAYRLAVDPPASKELRLFGLAGWTIDRFIARRTRLHELAVRRHASARASGDLEHAAGRFRERAGVLVAGERRRRRPHQPRGSRRVRAERNRRVDDRVRRIQLGSRRSGCSGRRGAAPRAGDASGRRTCVPAIAARTRNPRARFVCAMSRSLTQPADDLPTALPYWSTSISRFPPARRSPSWGRTAPAKPPSQSCCAACTIRSPAPSRSTASTFASSISRPGARASRPFSRTSSASNCRCATTWRPPARRTMSCAPRSNRPARRIWPHSDTVLARGYDGGTDLSGGQWQRVALARALAAVTLGAGVVLLDEPTAQLDVRGEAEIFDRLLAATRHCTTILISHRFSTVRHADRICVLEHGRVIELGTHDELMALGGRYRTMFDLQAQRFNVPDDEEGATYDVLS